jgi:hypothetical protein
VIWIAVVATAFALIGGSGLHASAQSVPWWSGLIGAGISAPVVPVPQMPTGPGFADNGTQADGETADNGENQADGEVADGVDCNQQGRNVGENANC